MLFPDHAAAGAKKGPRDSAASPATGVTPGPCCIPDSRTDRGSGVGAGAGSRRRLGEWRRARWILLSGRVNTDAAMRSPRRTGGSSKSRLGAALRYSTARRRSWQFMAFMAAAIKLACIPYESTHSYVYIFEAHSRCQQSCDLAKDFW